LREPATKYVLILCIHFRPDAVYLMGAVELADAIP
jgi:hypothetical protein